MTTLLDYIQKHNHRFLSELVEFLKIPSISADSSYKAELVNAANFLSLSLKKAGCDLVELHSVGNGHPIIYAEKIIDAKLPTILVYGHYDVQPPDPLELWDSPPFEPIIKPTVLHPDGAIFARGACDDKGQVYAYVKSLEYMVSSGHLSCNVKFIIEGEEEVGSPSLVRFLANEKTKLSCDIILVSDTSIASNACPTITTGLRGLVYMEVALTGPNRDLHSGVYGGTIANPINTLAKLIASLHDENNRVTIPNFYDDVLEITKQEQSEMEKIPFSLDHYKSSLGIAEVCGESGYSTLERGSTRPTLDVNGIWGGYTGEGSKTVIPSKAFAKISMRLVPNQDCKKIENAFENHLRSITPKGSTIDIHAHHGGMPYVLNTDGAAYLAAKDAYQKAFGIEPLPKREGGSIPIIAAFEKELGRKSVLMGFGLDSDAIHSPNEHFGVFNYLKAIETITYFFEAYAKCSTSQSV